MATDTFGRQTLNSVKLKAARYFATSKTVSLLQEVLVISSKLCSFAGFQECDSLIAVQKV